MDAKDKPGCLGKQEDARRWGRRESGRGRRRRRACYLLCWVVGRFWRGLTSVTGEQGEVNIN